MAFIINRLDGLNISRPSHRLSVHPDRHPATEIQVQKFESLHQVLQCLKTQHANHFWYRGQTGRYDATYIGSIAKLRRAFPAVQKVEIEFESLVPSLYRSVANSIHSGWSSYAAPTKVDQLSSAIRAIASSTHEPLRHLLADYFREIVEHPEFLVREVFARFKLGRVPLPRDRCAPGTSVSLKLLHLISIAQHYEYPSSMIDITKDVEVAAWFASHSWNGELAVSPGASQGVIYRLNAEKINYCLSKELESELNREAATILSGLLGFADISSLNAEFGHRPKAQRGGSVLGLENSLVYLLLDAYSAIDVFTFPRNSITGHETPIHKMDLCPEDDPLLEVFKPDFIKNFAPVSNIELETFLASEHFSSSDIGVVQRARRLGCL